MEKLSKYIGWLAAIVMLCGWIVSIMWIGRLVKENTEQIKKFNEFHESQLELNGKILMYFEMDSR